MRKGQNCILYLRHRSCAKVTRNTPNIVSRKWCVPKETKHYPDRKTSQILGIFFAKWEDIILLMKVKMLKLFITFSTPITIRSTHTVTFRSMHKHSFCHFKGNVKFVKYNKLKRHWTDTGTYSDLDCEVFKCNEHTNRKLSWFFRRWLSIHAEWH